LPFELQNFGDKTCLMANLVMFFSWLGLEATGINFSGFSERASNSGLQQKRLVTYGIHVLEL